MVFVLSVCFVVLFCSVFFLKTFLYIGRGGCHRYYCLLFLYFNSICSCISLVKFIDSKTTYYHNLKSKDTGLSGHIRFPLLLSQSYYYNLKTRETTWTKPEDVKIITQQDVDTLSNTPSASDDDKNGELCGIY